MKNGAGMKRQLSGLVVIAALAGCATTPGEPDTDVSDPLEGLNRKVFAFNEAADKTVIGPVADGYVAVTPGFVRSGVSNAMANLNSPVILANDILQGAPGRASNTGLRFIVNSTIGLVGLWDAAAHFGIEGHTEDFGQTLAVWGVGDGPFLVLPFLGPSNLRDFAGLGVDTALDPLTWTEFSDGDAREDLDVVIQTSRTVLGALHARVALDDQFETLREQPEPYVALKRIYKSQREADIRNGEPEDEPYKDLPDFDDF